MAGLPDRCPGTTSSTGFRTRCFPDGFADEGAKMAVIGYARVSTRDQELGLQTDALAEAGCTRTFQDHASGAKADRPGLEEALAYLRSKDTLVVWRLDRLGRSLSDLLRIVSDLEARGVAFRSLREAIDTSTSGGKLVFHIFGSLAEFERDLIRERTHAGLAAAAARGRKGGRRPVVTPDRLRRAQVLIEQGLTVREAAARVRVGHTALYEARKKAQGATPTDPRPD